MKRKIVVTIPSLRIEATLNTNGDLRRYEVEQVRDDLADALMRTAANAPYIGQPISRVKVR